MSLAAIAVGLSPVRADGPASTALPSPEPTLLGPGITPSYPGLTAGLIGDWIGPIGHWIGPIGDWPGRAIATATATRGTWSGPLD